MKKILSLALAAVMLVSALPVAYAADVPVEQGTAVTLIGEAESDYTITVPAQLQPGQSGTVTVQGIWSVYESITVSTASTVKLISQDTLYYDEKSVTANVEFDGIEADGQDSTKVTVTGDIAIADMDKSALFGTWTGLIEYDVETIDRVSRFSFNGVEYEVPYGTTWAEWVADQEGFEVVSDTWTKYEGDTIRDTTNGGYIAGGIIGDGSIYMTETYENSQT